VLIGRIGAISAISGGNSNLDSITAVVIGGTSLFGPRLDRRHIGRRAGRRRLPQRPGAGRADAPWQSSASACSSSSPLPSTNGSARSPHDRRQPILTGRGLVKRFAG